MSFCGKKNDKADEVVLVSKEQKRMKVGVLFWFCFALGFVKAYPLINSKTIWTNYVKMLAFSHYEKGQTRCKAVSTNDWKSPQRSGSAVKKTTGIIQTQPNNQEPLSIAEFQELQKIFGKNKAVMGVMKSTAVSNKPITSPSSVKRVIDTISKDEVNNIKKILDHNKLLMNNKPSEDKKNNLKTTYKEAVIHDKNVLKEINKVKESIPIPANLTEEEEIAKIFERNRALIDYINQEIIKINEAFTNKKKKPIRVTNYLTLNEHHLNNHIRHSRHQHRKHLPSPMNTRIDDITYNRDAILHFLQIFENKNPNILTDIDKDNEIVYRGALDESSFHTYDDDHRIYLVHIDLHGLPLIPALQIVRSCIYYYSEKFPNQNVNYIVIKFIVGIGKHSAHRQPVLGPQIGRILKQDYYHDILTNKGEIVVRIEN